MTQIVGYVLYLGLKLIDLFFAQCCYFRFMKINYRRPKNWFHLNFPQKEFYWIIKTFCPSKTHCIKRTKGNIKKKINMDDKNQKRDTKAWRKKENYDKKMFSENYLKIFRMSKTNFRRNLYMVVLMFNDCGHVSHILALVLLAFFYIHCLFITFQFNIRQILKQNVRN